MFQIAHHDIWWAKGQMWSASNWAIALIGVVVGLGRLLNCPDQMEFKHTWPFLIIALFIAISAALYLARLHYDVMNARRNSRYLRRKARSLDKLIKTFPTHKRKNDDASRGIFFVCTLIFFIAIALGIATYVLATDLRLTFAFSIIELLAGAVFLCIAKKRAFPLHGD
jgi:uncharacterized membrane protein YecN with MAPEG domain